MLCAFPDLDRGAISNGQGGRDLSADTKPAPGSIAWTDLTVPEAEHIRDFYQKVAGWRSEAVDMGGYSDFNMHAGESGPIAGICHARDSNATIPPQWMIYIVVSDLDGAMRRCRELGGEIVREPGDPAGGGRFCVLRDPAGAVAALFEPAAG